MLASASLQPPLPLPAPTVLVNNANRKCSHIHAAPLAEVKVMATAVVDDTASVGSHNSIHSHADLRNNKDSKYEAGADRKPTHREPTPVGVFGRPRIDCGVYPLCHALTYWHAVN